MNPEEIMLVTDGRFIARWDYWMEANGNNHPPGIMRQDKVAAKWKETLDMIEDAKDAKMISDRVTILPHGNVAVPFSCGGIEDAYWFNLELVKVWFLNMGVKVKLREDVREEDQRLFILNRKNELLAAIMPLRMKTPAPAEDAE